MANPGPPRATDPNVSAAGMRCAPFFAIVALGCTSSNTGTVGPPQASEYSQACAVDADCAVVDTSNDACCGGCASAAIARSDLARFQADRSRFRATCSSAAPCPDRSCPRMAAVCTAGRCAASACAPTCPGEDAGTDVKSD